MLQPELRDQDIPHRTTIRKRVLEVLNEYTVELKLQLKVSFTPYIPFDIAESLQKAIGRISLTTNVWSDPPSLSHSWP
jgi:hypothetical protein